MVTAAETSLVRDSVSCSKTSPNSSQTAQRDIKWEIRLTEETFDQNKDFEVKAYISP